MPTTFKASNMKFSFPLLLAVLLISPVPSQAPLADSDEHQTSEVVSHHWKTFTATDIEEPLADYTEDSVLITPQRVYRGLKEIRENFMSAFKNSPKTSSTLL